MKFASMLGVVLCAALAVAILAPVSRASETNQLSRLTFSDSFEVPGNKVLAAGTYWFRILNDSAGMRNVILIFNSNHSQLDATLLANAAFRWNTTEHTDLVLANNTRRHPFALMEWFYPDRQFGHAFVYPARLMRQFREGGLRSVIATPEIN